MQLLLTQQKFCFYAIKCQSSDILIGQSTDIQNPGPWDLPMIMFFVDHDCDKTKINIRRRCGWPK